MKPDSKETALQNLKNRVRLITRGVVLPKDSVSSIHLQSIQGGAGPQGTAYYVGEAPGDHHGQISLLVYPEDHYLAHYALSSRWWDGHGHEHGHEPDKEGKKIVFADEQIFLEEVPFNWSENLPNDPFTMIVIKGRSHPYRTYSMSLYRSCRHLEEGEGCKFCTINVLVDRFNLPRRQTDQTNLEYLKMALASNPVRSVTLTSGTFKDPETTGSELLAQARLIRENTKLGVHVQVEPVFDQELFRELSEVADSVGIFLEFFDERVRQKICPGKSRVYTPEDYLRSWEMAVSSFGRGKVLTTNIIGFDEDYEVIIKGIEQAAKIGVVTSILPIRVGSSSLGDFVPSYLERGEDEVLKLHQELGQIMVKYGIDSNSQDKAGCLGCGGCVATKEAITWARMAQ